ncbi:copper amine oxidase domain protein [Desulforamulus reducens MI-1]|uniref:Copper amine oxidase domain protein n=1 Tax=Desulforamulus reducens (strain ATCC BAA-1160 / DSM 100696 / MI-1) TaxID=349161 RepID=A4J264_DESRM|nr:stalk domain-containing protein [Desulforamulus reducens]ABO49167.1 copper amine oxidase domain protein [Desulforamulus reducens MI-1]
MKKFMATVFTLALLFNCVASAMAAPANNVVFYLNMNKYVVDNSQYTMDAAPFIEKGRIFVPIRYLAYACGVVEQDVQWHHVFETVTLKRKDTTLQLQVGINQAIKNDLVEELDISPIMKGDRTYLPARWIAESLGYQVQWNEKSKTMVISQNS